MDSKIEIEIEFDQPNAVYFSGQIVSGTVQISLTEPKTVEGVLLNIHGFGKTEWHKGNQSKPPDYVGFEEYLLMNTYLLDCLNESSIELPVGVQSFPFQYQLPNNLPSSYEGMYGHLPIEAENQKSYCCGFCKTEPLILKATLAQTGFIPGQIIPVKIHISSKSIEVLEIRLYLRKLVTYRAEKPMVTFKEECVELCHKTSGHLQFGSVSTFEEKLQLPSVPPTTLLSSKIIQINYDVKIEAVLTENRNTLVVLCPLTVGSTSALLNSSNAAIIPVHRLALQDNLANAARSSQGQLTVEIAPPDYVIENTCENEGSIGTKKVPL